MRDNHFWILTGEEVASCLADNEPDIVETVTNAYLTHHRGKSSLPHSTFLRFPGDERNRIIALPAYLGDGFDLAGMKWVSSFPGNLALGIERASAVVILNSPETGRPLALFEGSLISAHRTAASAALAARTLLGRAIPLSLSLGLIGTGVINREIARYVTHLLPGICRFLLFDLDSERVAAFAGKLRRKWPEARRRGRRHFRTLRARSGVPSMTCSAPRRLAASSSASFIPPPLLSGPSTPLRSVRAADAAPSWISLTHLAPLRSVPASPRRA